jgi:pimeloyl-ACP methyl ester carboxylesterase
VRVCPSPLALISFIALGLQCAAAQTVTPFQFQFTERPGPYAVGLRVVEQSELSGGSPVVVGVPLQTLVWYPAIKSGGKLMTFGDYGALIKKESTAGKPVDHVGPKSDVDLYMHGIMALPTWAVRDGPIQAGRFPLVIYAPSLNAPAIENIELCEYLASYGFVVMASPSVGATSGTMTVDVAGANAQARDISVLIDFAKTLPNADVSEIAAVGYSWGGMAALFAAARDSRIDALISLDGSFRYSPGTVQAAGDVHPDKMVVPLLVFSRAEETLESWDAMQQNKCQGGAAPSVLNEWTQGDLLHVHLLAVSHIQFSSLYQRSDRFRKEGLQFSPADYTLKEGAESYNWMARYTLEFLNAYLKRDESSMLFLRRTPAENGVPKHLVAAAFRQTSGAQAIRIGK